MSNKLSMTTHNIRRQLKPGSWRARCAPTIAEVIQRVGTDDERALRSALREAYPFGERKYFPYKVWLDEIKIQLGKKRPKRAKPAPNPNQLHLF